jgi:Ni,Fe-hydrogenase I large subunit
MNLQRVEGQLELVNDAGGRLVPVGFAPFGLEDRLIGRSALEAIYLCQQVSAANGVAHAIAAARAWEAAGQLSVAPNGELLRELLNLMALLHHHVQHFYFQTLPDYLPVGELADYAGTDAGASRMAAGLGATLKRAHAAQEPASRFPPAIRRRLIEHIAEAPRVLGVLQRALARLGGKYPVVMSVVPGGVTTRFGEDDRLQIDSYLKQVEPFLAETVLEDGLAILEQHPGIAGLGRGPANFLCVGAGARLPNGGGELFPPGLLLGRRLQALSLPVTESIQRAFYRISRNKNAGAPTVELAPDKEDAYTWIKAPRVGGAVVETGAIARLAIIQLSGVHGRSAGVAELVQDQLGVPAAEANTVAGRMLARLGELDLALRRCLEILRTFEAGHPSSDDSGDPFGVSGEGVGYMESPSGSIRHRVVLEDGRIRHYDIISASTWNGSSRDKESNGGALELALANRGEAGDEAADRLAASRVVQSFAFSTSDAVH